MKTFKQWLIMMGYDLGLEEHLYVKEPSWDKVRNVDVFKLVAQYIDDETKDLQKIILDLRSDIILQDEDYKNLQDQLHEERKENDN
jgi:hypothetical protein